VVLRLPKNDNEVSIFKASWTELSCKEHSINESDNRKQISVHNLEETPTADMQEVNLCFLRQQHPPFLCLSDFISPETDQIGLFAVSVDANFEQLYAETDSYRHLLAQTLADRLAEATAEMAHEQVRRSYWGYATDEHLSVPELHKEHFQGIRPAVGYPSLPDQSINFDLDRLLHFSTIGISLTEHGAMQPHASVSGLMLAHPKASYFSVGPIGEDQLADYAQRRGVTSDELRPYLSGNIRQ